ncbi:MAG: proline--tRNA ligase [Aeriscardovia sp.]|nr:proline--tRNA ligase [Aeriscardovia sp.]
MTSTPLRMSSLFLRTLRDAPADEDIDSAKLLVRAGYIRKEAPGVFAWLPLGLRVLNKIEGIVREEMASIGAQEVHLPALLPREPYETTHRWEEYGDNIFKLTDRHQADYLLAPTHEEMFTLLAKNMYSSYKDLPVTLYQIQTKYRDEARPRAGLIRGREFIMKDAYSFTRDEEGLKECYRQERAAYERVYQRLGVKYIIVHAFSGPMGGSESEEFLAPLPIGEDTFAQSPAGRAWNVEALKTPALSDVDFSATPAPFDVATPDAGSINDIVAMLNAQAPRSDRAWQAGDALKNIALTAHYPDGHAKLIVVGLPGDREVDLKRVEACLSPLEMSLATDEELAQHPELVKGFIGPMALGPQAKAAGVERPVEYYLDAHIAKGSAWVSGANTVGRHTLNLVYGRDFVADGVIEASQLNPGDMSPDGSGPLSFQRGVEIGQVFQLGRKYTDAFGFTVLDENGKAVPVWMGSYGIGVSRVLACVVEFHHDGKGIMWPVTVAPAQVHVVMAGKSDAIVSEAEEFVSQLSSKGIEVLFDDRRKVRPGVKFNDAELLGMPVIAVVGRDFEQNGTIELRLRDGGESQVVLAEDAAGRAKEMVDHLLSQYDVN